MPAVANVTKVAKQDSLGEALDMVDLAVGAVQADMNVAMLKAIRDGNVPKAKELLDHPMLNIDPNAAITDTYNYTWDPFLVTAAAVGSWEIVQLLVNAGADLNAVGHHSGLTALCEAIANKDRKTFDVLLRAGADLDATSDEKATAVHLAASYGRFHMLESLLKRGANPNAEDRVEHTPMYYAKLQGHEETQNVLKKYGGRMYREEWPEQFDADLAAELEATSWVKHVWNDTAFQESV